MYLKELKLWNFRKYGSNTIDLNTPHLLVPFRTGLNVLIGENDSGKTTIIDAIKIVLRTHSGEWIGIDESDFHSDSNRLRIELIFDALSEAEASNFTEYLSLTDTNPAQHYLVVFVDVEKNENKVLAYDIKTGIDPDGNTLNALAREFLKVTYLRPLRDAKAELIPRRNSRLSQILRAHAAFRGNINEHHLLVEFRKFNRTVSKYFEGKNEDESDLNDQRGKALKDKIDEYLKSFSGKKSQFLISEGEIKQILERLELSFYEEKNLGLGSHNLLFMAAELLHLNKTDWTGLRLGLIEEIEAHLHPQVQLQVINSLNQIQSIQLIITTHSPNIGSKIDLDRLIVCGNSNIFPMGSSYTLLRDTDYSFLRRFLDVTKANLFFAKGVILVEGWSEELLLNSLARLVNVDLTAKGVSIVNVANTAFLRYSAIFRRRDGKIFNMPVAVVTDLDVKPNEENDVLEGGITKAERAKTFKEAKFNGDPVRTFVSPHWTFEYCLALSQHLREHLFNAIVQAGQDMTTDGYTGKSVTITWNTFIENKNDQQIAETMYSEFVGKGKKISKSIIAQKLSLILDQLPINQFATIAQDNSLEYLLNAIRYAARIN